MIDLRILCLEIEFEGRRFFIPIRKRLNRLEVISLSELDDGGGCKPIDFNYVNRTPFTFRNVCWAIGYNLKKVFKFLFAKVGN